MKKILSLLCIITLICTLCGCELDFPKNAKAVDFSLVNTKTPNYNNSYYASDFYGDEDICLYSKYGSYTHIMAYYKGEKIRILNDKNFENICFDSYYYIYGNNIYFSGYDYTDDDYDEIVNHIYRYNFANHSYEEIFNAKSIYDWKILNNSIIFTRHYDSENGFDNLYIYDTVTRQTSLIANEIEAYGIVNDKINYITFDNIYTLKEYDLLSKTNAVLGKFEGYSNKESIDYNFTENGVMMQPYTANENSDNPEISFYNIKLKRVAKYKLPEKISQITAANKYAFALCYTEDNSNDDEYYEDFENDKYSVYKIDLTNGDFNLLDCKADYWSTLYVATDDLIFVLNRNDTLFSYKTKVVKFNVKDNIKTELFSYE